MRRGFLYLVAVMDWATRKVLSWRVSNTLDVEFCIEVASWRRRHPPPDPDSSASLAELTRRYKVKPKTVASRARSPGQRHRIITRAEAGSLVQGAGSLAWGSP
jgi:hypothetical protein